MKNDNAASLSNDRTVDLSDEISSRSHAGAAEKLANLGGDVIARELMDLSPGFAQDVLGELSTEASVRSRPHPPTLPGNGSATPCTTQARSAA